MCDVVRRFLDSIAELKGNEYVKRAIAYISTFIPEEKRNEMELLDFLYQLTDRDDVKKYRCELIAQAMTREQKKERAMNGRKQKRKGY